MIIVVPDQLASEASWSESMLFSREDLDLHVIVLSFAHSAIIRQNTVIAFANVLEQPNTHLLLPQLHFIFCLKRVFN